MTPPPLYQQSDSTPNKKYRVIVVDPPWNQGKTGRRKSRPNQTATLGYKTLGKEALLQLPVREWADDRCFL